MASTKDNGGKKPNWPMIALIAFCVCVIIAAAALVTAQFMPKKQSEPQPPAPDAAETEPEEPEPPEDNYPVLAPSGAVAVLDEYDPENDSRCNVLLMGVDKGESLTDVIMIYQIDEENKKVNLLSVPRDSRVTYNGHTEKINAVHVYGRNVNDPEGGDRADEYAIKAVRELTGLPIHHFACINLQAFRDIIDALDGFDFEVPRNMNYDDKYQDLHIHLTKGMQHLDGDKAEQLVRFRKYTNGDIDRVKTQQSALRALIEQKATGEYIEKIPEIFETIKENVSTDLTPVSAAKLAGTVMEAGEDGLRAEVLPGSFGDIGGVSYWIPDRAGIDRLAKDLFGY